MSKHSIGGSVKDITSTITKSMPPANFNNIGTYSLYNGEYHTVFPHQSGDITNRSIMSLYLEDNLPFNEGDVLRTDTGELVRVIGIGREEDFFETFYHIHVQAVNDITENIKVKTVRKAYSTMSMQLMDFKI